MRDELTANGISVKNLESTLPPLKITSPPPAPALNRASTTPAIASVERAHSPAIPTIQRAHSPSLPVKSHNITAASTGESEWIPEIRDVTPKRPLETLILDTTKTQSTPSLTLPLQNNSWDDGSQAGITMSFVPDSPQTLRHDFEKIELEPSRPLQRFAQKAQKPESNSVSSVSKLPYERNVWDDGDFDGSDGNITMHFE
jgi:hypothetical protein